MRTLISEIIKKDGEEVELYGWVHSRRDHGKLVFIDLRDRSGLVQVVFGPETKEAGDLRLEYVIKLTGRVAKRPEKLINDKLPTGAYEIQATGLVILNKAFELPMPVDTDGYDISEDVRMKYRYLDLRRERLQKNIILRHRIVKFMRDFLDEKGFLEIETPILTKSTPEGARDYLVPSRVEKGNFYALPQSPQQYKQLLMVAGMEKYFQIARCFRDEDTRGDRQPEFTQLDIEISFTTQEEILDLIEELYINLVKKLLPDHVISQTPFPRLTYDEVMKKYGTDKPDLRKDKNNPRELAFAFVVDFPMFEWSEKEKKWSSAHHPFTMIKEKDLEFIEKKEYEKVRADSYDFVLNGYEMASGSIRINNSEVQKMVFETLGLKEKEIQEKFGHIIEAFKYGAPPHGGIAPGIDRFVMIVANEPNIREVIAFPKTGDGRDLMMGAPAEVDKDQLKELGLEVRNRK